MAKPLKTITVPGLPESAHIFRSKKRPGFFVVNYPNEQGFRRQKLLSTVADATEFAESALKARAEARMAGGTDAKLMSKVAGFFGGAMRPSRGGWWD